MCPTQLESYFWKTFVASSVFFSCLLFFYTYVPISVFVLNTLVFVSPCLHVIKLHFKSCDVSIPKIQTGYLQLSPASVKEVYSNSGHWAQICTNLDRFLPLSNGESPARALIILCGPRLFKIWVGHVSDSLFTFCQGLSSGCKDPNAQLGSVESAKQYLFQTMVCTRKGSQTRQMYPKHEAKGKVEKQARFRIQESYDYERMLERELWTSTNWRRDKTQRGIYTGLIGSD